VGLGLGGGENLRAAAALPLGTRFFGLRRFLVDGAPGVEAQQAEAAKKKSSEPLLTAGGSKKRPPITAAPPHLHSRRSGAWWFLHR
jgi:hypothetical protein